jgi:hypothetical protein
MVPVLVPTFEKLWFRFLLLKSYGSGSGSSSISKKKGTIKKKIEIFLPLYLVSCYTRKKFINFNKLIVKYE